MKHFVNLIVAAALTLTLWLVLLVPGREFVDRAWIPASAWGVFITLAWLPGLLPWLLRIDSATYGPIAFLISVLFPSIGAVLAAIALITARFAADSNGIFATLAVSPLIGATFILVLTAHVVSLAVFTRRSIGSAGHMPITDERATMQSQAAPPRSESEFMARPAAEPRSQAPADAP